MGINSLFSLNPKRRQFDTAQRVMGSSRLVNREVGLNHTVISAPSQAMAVEILNVSRESVISARKVLNQGLEEIIQG